MYVYTQTYYISILCIHKEETIIKVAFVKIHSGKEGRRNIPQLHLKEINEINIK